jgi:archaeal cell division control protein 6
VLLMGSTRSGAQELVKKLLFGSLPGMAASYGNQVKVLLVNCRIDRTLQAIMAKALKSLGQNYPTRGYSFEELLSALAEELRNNRVHLVVAFDEVDFLMKVDSSALHAIRRLKEAETCLSFLLISKTLDFMKSTHFDLTSTGWKEVRLQPYNTEELADVIASRSEAFNKGCLDGTCIPLVVDFASKHGDVRYALDLLYKAEKLADGAGSPRVLPEHVRVAIASLLPESSFASP